ncbi:unnamed protein product [Lampetra planeri]
MAGDAAGTWPRETRGSGPRRPGSRHAVGVTGRPAGPGGSTLDLRFWDQGHLKDCDVTSHRRPVRKTRFRPNLCHLSSTRMR